MNFFAAYQDLFNLAAKDAELLYLPGRGDQWVEGIALNDDLPWPKLIHFSITFAAPVNARMHGDRSPPELSPKFPVGHFVGMQVAETRPSAAESVEQPLREGSSRRFCKVPVLIDFAVSWKRNIDDKGGEHSFTLTIRASGT